MGNSDSSRYLGDGVYASYDGWHIVLDLRAQGGDRIALEPSVYRELTAYAREVWGTPPSTDGGGDESS